MSFFLLLKYDILCYNLLYFQIVMDVYVRIHEYPHGISQVIYYNAVIVFKYFEVFGFPI
jgi:hypothetical protein